MDRNQTPPLMDFNLFTCNEILPQLILREGAGEAHADLESMGAYLGTPEAIQLGFDANENPPRLVTHDRLGNRSDTVVFHPAWHELLSRSASYGVHNHSWLSTAGPHSHLVRGAAFYLVAQNEAGHCCPLGMAHAAVPVIRQYGPPVIAEWERLLLAGCYDPRWCPAQLKRSALIGMAMTEKQGGSDLRTNTTRALSTGGGASGPLYLLNGDKWFCSAPMCDAFLVLAQAPRGLSCFLVPRWLPEGRLNGMRLIRLKSKLGNRSNASAEIEFEDASGWLVGQEGRGVNAIIEMVNHTRLDCALSSAALITRAVSEALHNARYRQAFGRLLRDQPLMRLVLADLALEAEAATLLAMRVARSFDEKYAAAGAEPAALCRIVTAIAKFWVCKRAPAHVAEAIEAIGGNAYVEDSILPRLLRESVLNSVWEGAGNVICLDVLRAIAKSPLTLDTLLNELELAAGGDTRLDREIAELRRDAPLLFQDEAHARLLVERLAVALEASLMVRGAPTAVAEAFCASRLTAGSPRRVYGDMIESADWQAVIERSMPVWSA